jgi:HEAT repeat protein
MRVRSRMAIAVAATLLAGNLAFAKGGSPKPDMPAGLSPKLRALIEQTFSVEPKKRIEACTKLGEMGEGAAPAVPFLLSLRDDCATAPPDRRDVGFCAELALQAIGEPAVQPTIDALRGASAGQRNAIACVLGRFNNPRAVRALLPLLNDSDAHVRRTAAESVNDCLKQNPNLAELPGLIDFLIHALQDNDPDVRYCVVSALGELRIQRAFGPISKMLKDSYAPVRSAAIAAIGTTGGRSAEPILLELMRDRKGDADERGRAAEALGSIGDPAMVEVLIAALADASEPALLRDYAALGLGAIRDERAAPLLLKVVQDKSEPRIVRVSALRAFASIQGRRAIPVLPEIIWAKGYDAPPASAGEAITAWWVRRLAALLLVEATGGAIDDVRIVTIVALEGSEPVEKAREVHLPMIARNGRTAAVRAAARRALGTNKILGIDESLFFLILSIVYYTPAFGFWVFRYRKSLRQKQFTLGSLFLLTTLIAIGLPLAVATWNTW